MSIRAFGFYAEQVSLQSKLVDIGVHVLLELNYRLSGEGVRYDPALSSMSFSITGTEEVRADCDEGVIEITEEKSVMKCKSKGYWIYHFRNPEPWL